MKAKIIAVVEFLIILLLLGALLAQFVSFKKTKPVVREPEAPGESTLTYTPPAPPKFPIEVVRKLRDLKKNFTPTVDRITENIYLARGFALGSVMMVITDAGLVIIDTTEGRKSARKILARFREITDKPIKYIIYTHAHPDHFWGAGIFKGKETQIIATSDALEFMKKDFGWLKQFQMRSRLNQAGMAAPEFSRKLPVKVAIGDFSKRGDPLWPTITFDEEYSFELGGKKFELYHTTGETPGHLMVWLPDEKALFPGDLYYMSFPNLSTPMLEPRPVKGWYESLERMIPFKADYLIPSHTEAIIGADKVREVLTYHSRAIKYVYDETIKAINEGKTVDEAVESIKLPPELASRFHLQEFYGRVDWSVRGIYQADKGNRAAKSRRASTGLRTVRFCPGRQPGR